MDHHQAVYQSTFIAYYPDNDEHERLVMIGMLYGESFATGLIEKDSEVWNGFIRQIEKTKRIYEAERDENSLS